jgi:hypothetical protein
MFCVEQWINPRPAVSLSVLLSAASMSASVDDVTYSYFERNDLT